MLSGGNFHGQAVAMALDVLAIALTNLGTISERRIDRLVHPDLNQGLPPFLTPDAGVNSGFMMAQVTAAALASECKVLAHPASVDTIPTDGSKEDVVPMAMTAAVKLRRIVENVRHVLAIELMCARRGSTTGAPLRPGAGRRAGARAVRALVAPLGRDRVLAGDIAAAAALIADGALDECLPLGYRRELLHPRREDAMTSTLPPARRPARRFARRADRRSPARDGSRKRRCAC